MISNISSILDNKEWNWNYEKMYIKPNIPAKKLNAAINSYASTVNPDRVLVLLDDTVFGGSKEGLLLTEDGIYSKELFQEPKSFSFDQIKSIAPGTKSRIFINNSEFFKATVVEHFAVLALASRIATTLGINDDKERKPAEAKTESSIKNANKGKFETLHDSSLLNLKNEFDEGCFLFDELIDKQMRILLSQSQDVESALIKNSTATVSKEDIEAQSAEFCLLLFLTMHFYSLSNISDDFKNGMGESFQLLHTLSLMYAESFKSNFEHIYNKKFSIDDETLHIVPIMFMNKDGESNFDLKMPREQVLTMLLEKLELPKYTAQKSIGQFETAVNWWINALVREMMKEEMLT
ncbi:hypothetical protein [Shewanella cyperi]|uniref:hypothetical protein n=1 Tax=Shewanella cyperi TaxID=2814292 RepID=UPI001A941455|nr:hypothetical protein [Shewanella cyperi]QSX39303.1 hypothetical protein JYB84_09515 [Shewanella cyperi]